jgi:hypothetical protein
MKCKKCERIFHYCTSCSPEFCNDEGYCSNTCLNDHLDYNTFYKFFKSLLHKTESCFERDVLRESKQVLWESWIYLEKLRLKSLEKNEK